MASAGPRKFTDSEVADYCSDIKRFETLSKDDQLALTKQRMASAFDRCRTVADFVETRWVITGYIAAAQQKQKEPSAFEKRAAESNAKAQAELAALKAGSK